MTPLCTCGKKATFRSARLEASFCSDECYERAQRPDPAEPHIVVTRKQGAYFAQGDIMFPVNHHNLELTLAAGMYKSEQSCIDKLMDSQVVSLAVANGLPVQPFVRELVRSPLHGIVQFIWYQDLKHRVDFANLTANQAKRIADYKRALTEYVPAEEGKPGKRVRSSKALIWQHSYRACQARQGVASGRERQLYEVIRGIGQGTFAQIVEAAQGKVKSKQDHTKIVHRFLKQLIVHGAVEEIKI